jgi:hypothetical protein
MCAAGGVAIDQSTKADLVCNPSTCQSLSDNADHDPKHGGTAVEQLNVPELLEMDLMSGAVLIPLLVGGNVFHDLNRGQSGTGLPGP